VSRHAGMTPDALPDTVADAPPPTTTTMPPRFHRRIRRRTRARLEAERELHGPSAPPRRATSIRWAAGAWALACVVVVACGRREPTVPSPTADTAGSTADTAAAEALAPEPPLPLLSPSQLDVDEHVEASEPLPDAPTPPADPAAAAFAAIVERSAGCYPAAEIDRARHVAPADCEALFSRLEAGGESASAAVGEYLAHHVESLHPDVVRRLSLLLAANPRGGVASLVRRLHELAAHDEAAARNGALLRTTPSEFSVRARLVTTFELATGYPVEFYAGATTRDEDVAHDRVVAVRALRFWHRHASDPSRWPRLGVQRVRSWLAADESRVLSAARLVRDRPAYAPMVPEVRDILRRLALHHGEARVLLEDLDRRDDPPPGSLSF
jgi:hypothetical protein